MDKKILLVVLDGFGIRKEKEGNAIALANTPVFDDLFKNYPHSFLQASGEYVGLPKGQMGNSEVGHLNIGAGEIVYTGLSLINKAIQDKTFKTNPQFLKSINFVKKNHSTLHLVGMLSPGGVHSLQDHLFELIDLAHEQELKDVTVHVFLDGRDVAPKSCEPWLKMLDEKLKKYNFQLGSIMGRLYGMDRDKRFEKTQLAFNTLQGKITNTFSNPIEYLNSQYEKNILDEFIEPAINVEAKFLKDNDSVIFFNFRPDRARQLAHFIKPSNLYDVKIENLLKNVQLTTMMKYEGIDQADVAFSSMEVKNPLGKVIADHNLKQLRVAETQKYAHVTFFFDGGVDVEFKNEERILVPSLKIDNYALEPQMSAKEISDKIIENLEKYDVIIANYANPDMVGHTGDLKAAIKAIEVVDNQIGRLLKACELSDTTIFITSDHGNAEVMLDKKNKPSTKHTDNVVPFITNDKNIQLKDGILANVSPTILDYLKIEKPESTDQESLII